MSDFGVHVRLGHVLLVCLQIGDTTLSPIAIEPEATVQIPWWLGPHKQAFRPFAETLAAGMAGATVYETAKMWRVRHLGRVPRIASLMQDPTALRSAFDALLHALNASEPPQ